MKLKIPTGITNRFGRQLLHVQKASPQIMFGAGVVGIIGAGVLACRSTLKLSDVLEEAELLREYSDRRLKGVIAAKDGEDEYTEKMHKKDQAVLSARTALNVAKLYAPAVGLAVASVGLLTGSHIVLNRRNASLSAAYMAVDQAYEQYRDRVRAELGEDQDRKFRYGTETIEETVAKKDGGTKVVKHERVAHEEPSQYARFFDQLCDNWTATPEYNKIFLLAQQNYANNLLQARGHVFLNEIYDMLGMERSGAGAVVGWVWGKGGDDYIDFGIFEDKTNARVRDFVNGRETSILLDFNVDGEIYRLI